MSVIAIPKILNERLTEEGAQALAAIFEKLESSSHDRVMQTAEDRFEKRLTEEVAKVQVQIHSVRADIIKWMFLFWAGQVGTITAILFAFFKH